MIDRRATRAPSRWRAIALVLAVVGSSAASPPARAESEEIPLPLGEATAADAAGLCPTGSTCTGVAILCDGVPGLSATLATMRPADPAVTVRGLVLFISGSDGTTYYGASTPP